MTADPLLQFVIAGTLALVFLSAARHKRAAPLRFRAQLAAYGLVPKRLVAGTAALLPWAELTAALLLLPPASRAVGAAFSVLLLTAYALAMGINLLRGRRAIDCGCGDAAQPLSWALVLRNVALVLAASLLIDAPGARSLHAADAMLAVALVALLTLAWATINQLLANAALLRGEVSHES